MNQKFAFKIYISFFWIKKFDVERFLEKIILSPLTISKKTKTLAEPDVRSPTSMNFNMKNFKTLSVLILSLPTKCLFN